MKTFLCASTLAGVGAVSLTGCSRSPERQNVELSAQVLARDSHFMVGGHHIVIPAIALDRPDHTFDLHESKAAPTLQVRLGAMSSDPDAPTRVDTLDIVVRQYQYTEPVGSSVCSLLSRKWSQLICRGKQHGLLTRLPEAFELLDRTKLENLQHHYTVGRELQYDQVKDMALRPGVAEIGCDRASQFCTAVVEVLPGLLAIWTVWPDEKSGKTAAVVAEIQGTALVQFVRRSLGQADDPTLIDAD